MCSEVELSYKVNVKNVLSLKGRDVRRSREEVWPGGLKSSSKIRGTVKK